MNKRCIRIIVQSKIILCLFITIYNLFFCRHVYSQTKFKGEKKTENQLLVISSINIKGNKQTKKNIIIRELTFSKGDTILLNNIDHHIKTSENYLLKTPLFNYVTIDTIINISYNNFQEISILIRVEERWYLLPEVEFSYYDRNFNTWWKTHDFSRTFYGLYLTKYNFRGKNEKIGLGLRLGFNERFLIYYKNIYLDTQRKHALNLNYAWSRQKSIAYKTYDNKLEFFYSANNYSFKTEIFNLNYSFRYNLYNYHLLTFSYSHFLITDTILSLNNNFLSKGIQNNQYVGLRYVYVRDTRDSKYYPLTGSILTMDLEKTGFGIYKNNKINILNLWATFNKHQKLSNSFYFTTGVKVRKSLSQQTGYLTQSALGYDDNLRGFEYYVVDGKDFILSKNQIKYKLLPQKIIHLKRLSWQKFNKIHYALYANAFFDLAYVSDKVDISSVNKNTLVNRFLYSGGVGIDLVTYYDKILRIEYAINMLGESGIFLHFREPFKVKY